jgi:hypothetical protein
LVFLFEVINARKRQLKPEKTASSKKRKAEYILSTEINEINLTTSSDEGEIQVYLFTSSNHLALEKLSYQNYLHPTINH